jgi:hypothetical protein
MEGNKVGVLLKSVGVWLDDTGFHGMKFGMEVPDMAPDMRMDVKDASRELFEVMSKDDLIKFKEFNER